MQKHLVFLFLFVFSAGYAQKKPLDHRVYDARESVGLKQLSNDGEWIAYSINPQEGDGKP
jgi:hypothetical protein